MTAPAASPPADIGLTCTFEEIFVALDKLMTSEFLSLSNVIRCINPHEFNPQHLPNDSWFYISLKEKPYNECGSWKISEDACEVLSNSDIIGWRTTLEYYEGQAPHERKTDWLMQQFNATQKRPCDDIEKKETSALCRIFLVPSNEMRQNAGIVTETRNRSAQAPALDAQSSTRIGSSSNAGVNKLDETEVLAVAETLPVTEHQGENYVEMDVFSGGQNDLFPGGNFLELKDLATSSSSENSMDLFSGGQIDSFSGGDFLELKDLASSSSSGNSSAMSISSDACFDSVAFSQDHEDPVSEQSHADRRLNVSASNKLDEVVMVPAALESLVSVEGSNSDRDAKGDQRAKGPSSSSRKPSTSPESHPAASGERRRAAFGGMKKLRKKYLCFLPF